MKSDKKCPKCGEPLEEVSYASDKPEGQNAQNVSHTVYNCLNPQCAYFNKSLSNTLEVIS